MTKLKKYKFSDLYEMSSGISSKPEQAGHGAPFVSFSTVFNNYFLPQVLPDRMDTEENDQEKCSVKRGDLFLTRTSETLDELGMSCVAVKDYPNATFSGFLKRFRPIQKDITYHKYLAFYLRSKLFRKTMSNNAIMTLRASFNEQIFSYLDLLLPEYKEQVKAGDLLYLFNEKIELNNKINAELEAMAKLIYDYWFVQFDFPDKNGKPYKSSGGKMVYNQELKREIPEGWEVKNLGDYALIKKGKLITEKTANVDGKIKVVSAGLDYSYFHSEANYPENTITISASGASAGFINFWREPIFACDCTTVRGSNEADTLQLLGFLKMRQEYIYQQARGSAQPHVYPKDIEGLKIAVPHKGLINAYGELVNSGNKKIGINLKENQKLAELRDWLLPMLMNGQVKVGEIEKSVQLNMAAEPEVSYVKKPIEKEEQAFLKRKVLASYIINHSLNDNYFGNVKFEKLLHLADYHAVQRNLGQKYLQQAAGPYDNAFTYAFFTQVEKAKWFKRQKLGNLKKIVTGENHDKSTNTYNYFSDEELKKVDNLINKFKNSNYEQPEIVSTLYAVWNNRIIKQEPITDELLKQDFLKWDQQKAKYKDRLDDALQWMREENLVPNGWGPIIEKSKKKK